MCFDMGLTLREGNREYYYAALDRYFPGLKQKYIQTYGNAYELPSPHAGTLMRLFQNLCIQYGMLYETDAVFRYLGEFPEAYEQLSIFDAGG